MPGSLKSARPLLRALLLRFETVQRIFLDCFPVYTGTPSKISSFFLFESPLMPPFGRILSLQRKIRLNSGLFLRQESGTNRASRFASRWNFEGFGYRLPSVTRRGPVPPAFCGAAQPSRCYVQRGGWYLLFCQPQNETTYEQKPAGRFPAHRSRASSSAHRRCSSSICGSTASCVGTSTEWHFSLSRAGSPVPCGWCVHPHIAGMVVRRIFEPAADRIFIFSFRLLRTRSSSLPRHLCTSLYLKQFPGFRKCIHSTCCAVHSQGPAVQRVAQPSLESI